MTAASARRLTRDEARRIAVRAQLLDAERPHDLGDAADRLTLLQLDPTAAVAPSADLVAWSRLGNAYEPAHLQEALERDRTLFEHRCQETDKEPVVAMMRPMADLGLYLAEMAAWPSGSARRLDWMTANDGFRRRVLDQLRASGPLASRDIPDTSQVPWESTGWTHDRNVTQMLEFLAARGEVAVAGRLGRQRLWDLAERVYPAGMAVVPADEARRIRDGRRLRSLGVARPKIVGEAGMPGRDRGHVRRLARRPGGDRRGLRGTHRAAVAVRPAGPRPGARARAVRLRVHPRDVQAERQASLGLLRAPGAPRRPARRQGRRHRRPPRPACPSTPCTRTSPSPVP